MKVKSEDLFEILASTAILTVFFALVLNYLLYVPFNYAFVIAFAITVICVMGHEFVHAFYAEEFCDRRPEFEITRFALVVTVVSIAALMILIWIEKIYGFHTNLIPLAASPGGMYIAMRKRDRCYDNIAIAAPFYNLIVGIVAIAILFTITSPPFVLNDVSNITVAALANIAFFSLALALFNALPLKFGDVALDGYWTMTVDRSDYVTKVICIATIAISFVLLFATQWWYIIPS